MPDLENAENNVMSVCPPLEPTSRPMCDEKKEHYLPRRDLLKQYEITMSFFDVGCIIRIGCKTVAFSTSEEAMKEFNEYVAKPREAIEKWNKIFKANE